MAITIVEKNDDISWDALAKIQYIAHHENRTNGIDQACAYLSGEQLKNNIGNGRCFVAMDENKPIGIACYRICKNYRKYWFCNGETVAELLYSALLPEYQKGNTFYKLVMTRNAAIEEDGAEIIVTDTHERNTKMRDIFILYGFNELCYHKYISCNYISIVMAKWLNSCCPFSETLIKKKLKQSRLLLTLTVNAKGSYFFIIKSS